MDREAATEVGSAAAVLHILETADDQLRPGLLDRECLHSPNNPTLIGGTDLNGGVRKSADPIGGADD